MTAPVEVNSVIINYRNCRLLFILQCFINMDQEAAKQKCDRAKAIRRAYHGIISKLIREVDELISTNASTKEVQAH